MGFGKLNEFPDDEKIPGKSEASDEVDFVLKLFANLPVDFLVALLGSSEGQFTQESAFFDGRKRLPVLVVGGEPVAEIGKGELEAVSEALGVEHCFGKVVKEIGNLPGVFEVPFGVGCEQGSCLVEGGVMAKAGESIGQEAVPPDGEERRGRCQERYFKVAGEIDEKPVAAFLTADVVPGEREVEVVVSEDVAQPGCCLEKIAPERVWLQEGFWSEKSNEAGTPVGEKLVGRKLQ